MAIRSVDDASLTAVADAIRAKGGTSEALVFPDGFVSAVEVIQAGGDEDYLEKRLTNTLTSYENDKITKLVISSFAECISLSYVNFPNVTDI